MTPEDTIITPEDEKLPVEPLTARRFPAVP